MCELKHAPTIDLGMMAVSLSKLYHANSMYIIIWEAWLRDIHIMQSFMYTCIKTTCMYTCVSLTLTCHTAQGSSGNTRSKTFPCCLSTGRHWLESLWQQPHTPTKLPKEKASCPKTSHHHVSWNNTSTPLPPANMPSCESTVCVFVGEFSLDSQSRDQS